MELLEGKSIVKSLTERVKASVDKLLEQYGYRPKLVTLFIGQDTASQWYNKSIKKACEKVGIEYQLYEYSTIEYKWCIDLVTQLNKDETVHGILINQPLPERYKDIVQMIDPEKDVEGVTAQNLGKLMLNRETHYPCTPQAVMTIIDDYRIDLKGVKVCIVNSSIIVGKPLSMMMNNRNATVTLCHAKTKNLEQEIRSAELVVVAVGIPKYVQASWIKDGAIVIDVGTNYTENGLVGDVDFEAVKEKVSKITPVPGGVGGLTNIILLKNCVEAFMRQKNISY